MKYNKYNSPLVCMQTNSTCFKQTKIMNPVGILIHSTGAPNPYLKRYVQPSDDDKYYNELMTIIGSNIYKNDWNHIYREAGLNAWIGKDNSGNVRTIQSMPWNYRPWGCGSGANGSCNNGWIQYEICEPTNLYDSEYFEAIYVEVCELTAYLCQLYNINPNGTVEVKSKNGKTIQVPTILCHWDSYNLGMGSGHKDVEHWFPLFGKSMATVRADVTALLNSQTTTTSQQKEEHNDMTKEQFYSYMDSYLLDLANRTPSDWSQAARQWAESNGIILGDENGNKQYKKFVTREELIQMLFRAINTK